jgi:hypothetical protein
MTLGNANSVPATECGGYRNGLRPVEAVRLVARALWKRKTAANLAARSGASMRACEYWLARKTDMSADALANLLRSDAGFEILERIMGTAKPVWWRQFRTAKAIGAARQEQAELKRRAAEQDERISQLEMGL